MHTQIIPTGYELKTVVTSSVYYEMALQARLRCIVERFKKAVVSIWLGDCIFRCLDASTYFLGPILSISQREWKRKSSFSALFCACWECALFKNIPVCDHSCCPCSLPENRTNVLEPERARRLLRHPRAESRTQTSPHIPSRPAAVRSKRTTLMEDVTLGGTRRKAMLHLASQYILSPRHGVLNILCQGGDASRNENEPCRGGAVAFLPLFARWPFLHTTNTVTRGVLSTWRLLLSCPVKEVQI
jgi:hypothetical protein